MSMMINPSEIIMTQNFGAYSMSHITATTAASPINAQKHGLQQRFDLATKTKKADFWKSIDSIT